MGHAKTTAGKATRASLLVLGTALLCLALASPAQAALTHPRTPSLDITNLNHACGVAVDSKGDLYASSAATSEVKVYDPSHNLLTSIADTNQPCGLAVTTTGVLYVSEKATGEVVQFKPSAYPFSGTPTYGPREVIDASAKAKGIAVDPYDDGLYVAEGNRVSSYVNEFQTVTVENSTGGTFRLSFEGQKTPGGKEVGDVTSGSPTITSVLAASGTGTLTSGSTAVALQASAGEWVAGQSISGAGIPPGTTVTEVVSNTLTLSQAAEASGTGVALSAPGPLPFAVGETISGPGIPAGATIQSLGAGTITLSANATATTAAATLSTGLPYNATAAEVQGALAALPAIGAGNVEVTKPSSFLYSVFFVGKFAHTDVGTLSGNESGLTGPGPLRVRVSEKSRGRSAQIGEGVLGEASGVAAFTNFNALLDKSSSQAERFVWVADAGGLLKDRLYLFRSQNANVPTFDGRELDGATVPDGSFGFGTAGAYLAADPGNRNTAGECKVVGEQACTAGHLFLYDALHKALDEFDGSGEYLGQTKNAAFADAEPTAIAIERSGGTGDGTLYVTAGAAAGAKALAFGPLKAPSRAILGEPLSHKEVTRAQSVAVDSHGDVYVARAAASSSILIYGPSGVKITEITDQHKPRRVAVDSTGKVYVLDENKDGPASYEVTYYTPDKYPPDSTTTYTRRTEPIITPPKCGNLLIRTLAVNPGPGAGKDHLFVVCGENVLIYDSAAKGSGLIDKDFGKDLKAGVAVDSIAVDGATGTVYVGENRHVITGIDEVTKKFVVRFEDTGFSSGSFGSSPALAVDLSNGHVIEYDGVNKKAREYDRSGSFVAEFGTFTETAGIPYGIAVDNACVLHEPEPLSGKACEEYDPANGTAYVAFDDPSASNPPYDVSAFGGLKYPIPPVEPKEFKLTVSRSGNGSGIVTSSPAGIECGEDCSDVYAESTKVTLAATPAGGSTFAGFSGACSGTGTCEVTMSEAKSVTAEFKVAAKPKFALKVNKGGKGTGTVTSSPSGINCGVDCEEEYEEGTAVTLTGTAGANTKAVVWTGCDSVDGENKCHVTMGGAKEVTATFNLEQHLLSASKTGTGTGTVTSSPSGINCGSECSAGYDHGTKVTLTATPAGGSTFTGWSGSGCSGTATCEVTMSEAKSVTAEFKVAAKPKFALKVNKGGKGTGTVTSSPSGINCSVDCEEEYEEGTAVTLTGTAGANTKAVVWTGCDSVDGENKCHVTMGGAKEVTATFNLEQHLLSVSKTGTGTGTVTSSPSGINCGSECSAGYDHGTKVTLTATPAGGSTFTGWSGSGCSGTATCEVTMSEAKSVTATFDEEEAATTFPLTVAVEGTGTVTSSPGLISCNPFCSESFPQGTKVTLTASPDPGALFYSWKGCDTGGVSGHTCTVAMDKAKTVKAVFIAANDLTVSKVPGSGLGKVQSSPGGILCLAGCLETTAAFKEGTKVTLTATPAKHFHLVEWLGDCSGTGPCEVTMGEDHAVQALFAEDARFALTLTKEGGGTGTLKSTPPGIRCGVTCTSQTTSIYAGEEVELSATPAKGTAFKGWSVAGQPTACEGTGPCKLTMEAAKEVKAKFE